MRTFNVKRPLWVIGFALVLPLLIGIVLELLMTSSVSMILLAGLFALPVATVAVPWAVVAEMGRLHPQEDGPEDVPNPRPASKS